MSGLSEKAMSLAKAVFSNAARRQHSTRHRSAWANRSESDDDQILAITPFLADQVVLRQLITETGWKLGIIPEFEVAIARLQTHFSPVVLCDRNLPGFNWRDTLEILTSVASPSAVILMSAVVDEYLWDEVIQNRGFDVIAKPFRQEELIETIRFALFYRHWSCLDRIPR